MYKNQLQELAQRSCFNLPAYACAREGPDHAPRFKATVNFNGETFESPTFCSTLRQAEHAAAEVALNVLSKKGPSKALAAKVIDETGVYKNLLQETSHRAGLKLPVYTTVRSGPGHVPVFSCTVELAGMSFTGETAKTKKQAQKNAAMTAWSLLKKLSKSGASPSSSPSPSSEFGSNDEQEQVTVACFLASLPLSETNKASPRLQHHRHRSAPIQRDINRFGGNRSLLSLHHISWVHSQISPQASVYQSWLEDKAYHNQNNLLAVSALPTSPYRPQIVPFIHSVFQPDHRQYFLSQGPDPINVVPGISPVLCFSMHPLPVPVKSISQISIQEIEEKQQVEEKWLNDETDTNQWEKNFLSVAPRPSPNTAINMFDSTEQISQERKEKVVKQKPSRSTRDNGFSNLLESNHIEQHCFPEAINTDKASLSLRNQHVSDYHSSATSIRGCLPASFAAPVMVPTVTTSSPVTSIRPDHSNPLFPTSPPPRTNASTCSRRPWLEGIKNVGVTPSHSFIAPAVHIRSVVPVCLAPPVKRPTASIQERPFSGVDKNQVRQTGEVSGQLLDFGRLHI